LLQAVNQAFRFEYRNIVAGGRLTHFVGPDKADRGSSGNLSKIWLSILFFFDPLNFGQFSGSREHRLLLFLVCTKSRMCFLLAADDADLRKCQYACAGLWTACTGRFSCRKIACQGLLNRRIEQPVQSTTKVVCLVFNRPFGTWALAEGKAWKLQPWNSFPGN